MKITNNYYKARTTQTKVKRVQTMQKEGKLFANTQKTTPLTGVTIAIDQDITCTDACGTFRPTYVSEFGDW